MCLNKCVGEQTGSDYKNQKHSFQQNPTCTLHEIKKRKKTTTWVCGSNLKKLLMTNFQQPTHDSIRNPIL